MALISDPDNLSQGANASAAGVTWGTPTGAVVTLTAGATMPALTAGQYFAIRDHSVAVTPPKPPPLPVQQASMLHDWFSGDYRV